MAFPTSHKPNSICIWVATVLRCCSPARVRGVLGVLLSLKGSPTPSHPANPDQPAPPLSAGPAARALTSAPPAARGSWLLGSWALVARSRSLPLAAGWRLVVSVPASLRACARLHRVRPPAGEGLLSDSAFFFSFFFVLRCVCLFSSVTQNPKPSLCAPSCPPRSVPSSLQLCNSAPSSNSDSSPLRHLRQSERSVRSGTWLFVFPAASCPAHLLSDPPPRKFLDNTWRQ